MNCLHPGNEKVVEFLKNEIQVAQRQGRENLKFTLLRAVRSVREHPSELRTVRECLRLKGVGTYVGFRLKTVLDEGPAGDDDEETSLGKRKRPEQDHERASQSSCSNKKKKNGLPRLFSWKWGIVLTLFLDHHVDKEKPLGVPHTKQKCMDLIKKASKKNLNPSSSNAILRAIKELESDSLASRSVRQGVECVWLQPSGKETAKSLLEMKSTRDALATAGVDVGSLLSPDPQPVTTPVLRRHPSVSHSIASASSSSTVIAPVDIDLEEEESETITTMRSSVYRSHTTTAVSSSARRIVVSRSTSLQMQTSVTPIMLRTGEVTRNAIVSPVLPGAWELVLLLDTREKVSQKDSEFFRSKLLQKGINVELRALPLGDMMWIIRKAGPSSHENEYVTDYVIERKQASDFACSIKDGRYIEQKYRLERCGLQRVIYLVEGNISAQQQIMPQALETAMAETQVAHRITVHCTADASSTVEFLTRMHKLIKSVTTHAPPNRWSGPTMSFERKYDNFKTLHGKHKLVTVGEIFAAQLKQIRTCSGARAQAIVDKFPVPKDLVRALELDKQILGQTLTHLDDDSVERTRIALFKDLKCKGTQTGRRFGESVSFKIQDFFCRKV